MDNRTEEEMDRRINALLTRDYRGDEVTKELCHTQARYARRFNPPWRHDPAWDAVKIAERAAELSEQVWKLTKG